MSESPISAAAMPSTKRPLEDPSSPSAPTDQPDAKRPALDKILKDEDGDDASTAVEGNVDAIQFEDIKNEDVKSQAPTINGSTNIQGESVVSDTLNGTAQVLIQETQPIQSTSSHNDRATSHPPSNMPPQDETNWIHVRAVISSAEAATCIGKGGENVSQIRRLSNAKCTVSDYSRGAVERILTVSGVQDAVAKVCMTLHLRRSHANLRTRHLVSSFELSTTNHSRHPPLLNLKRTPCGS